jgi:uncharacterized protein YceH (UPF0502 family)
MSAPQSLLQAAVNRLAARLGSGLADTAATLSLLAQDAPARVQQELSLFWEEVEQEAARLDRQGTPATPAAAPEGSTASSSRAWGGFYGSAAPSRGSAQDDPQEAIDALRAQVAQLARRLDECSPRGAAGAPASSNQGPGPKA